MHYCFREMGPSKSPLICINLDPPWVIYWPMSFSSRSQRVGLFFSVISRVWSRPKAHVWSGWLEQIAPNFTDQTVRAEFFPPSKIIDAKNTLKTCVFNKKLIFESSIDRNQNIQIPPNDQLFTRRKSPQLFIQNGLSSSWGIPPGPFSPLTITFAAQRFKCQLEHLPNSCENVFKKNRQNTQS